MLNSYLAAIIVVAFGAPTIASANTNSDLQGVSVKVSYADLNLEEQEGANALYVRLKQASKQACDANGMTIGKAMKTTAELQRCYHQALSGAVRKVDNELVTQIHNS